MKNELFDRNQIVYCACGCGTKIKITARHRYDGIPKYISGHNARVKTEFNFKKGYIPHNKHKTYEESYGVEKAEQLKQEHSEKVKGQIAWNKDTAEYQQEYNYALVNPILCACGCGGYIVLKPHMVYEGISKYIHGHHAKVNNPFQGKKHTEESKQKMSETHQNITPYYSDTKPELALQEALSTVGIKFTTQKKLYGIPDIFIEPNICIFVDGCFYHACQLCYPSRIDGIIIGSTLVKDRVFKDQKVTNVLTSKGYTVLRFWEHEIYSNVESCIKLIP
jgi:DNA mismatch endonuclease (patch repair protein)